MKFTSRKLNIQVSTRRISNEMNFRKKVTQSYNNMKSNIGINTNVTKLTDSNSDAVEIEKRSRSFNKHSHII